MNILGIDFEEWYHPELIQNQLTTEKKIPKIVRGIDKILEMLRKNETFATFFMVGELLELNPELLDKILDNGHEIAFHTMQHTRLDNMTEKKFEEEVIQFKKLTNGKSKGFRAPTFSLNRSSSWALDVLEKNEYIYDSSIVPAKTRLYGMPNAERKPYKITKSNLEKNEPKGKLLEFPIMITNFLGKAIPAGGGFYLRVLPKRIIKNTIKKYEKEDIPATFYIHSWELTPEYMPKISLSVLDNFVTYHNLNKAKLRMDKILEQFDFTSFEKYMNSNRLNFKN